MAALRSLAREPAPLGSDLIIESWKRMFIDGLWTLAELEHHLEGMLPLLTVGRDAGESRPQEPPR